MRESIIIDLLITFLEMPSFHANPESKGLFPWQVKNTPSSLSTFFSGLSPISSPSKTRGRE